MNIHDQWEDSGPTVGVMHLSVLRGSKIPKSAFKKRSVSDTVIVLGPLPDAEISPRLAAACPAPEGASASL